MKGDNMIKSYKRSANSPWMTVPLMTRGAVNRFLMLGTYYAISFADGSVKINA